MRLITVVMKEPDSTTRNSETVAMLDYGFNMYSMDKILTSNNSLGKVKVNFGKEDYVTVVPKEDIKILNNKNEPKRNVKYTLDIKNINAPIKAGDSVGKINVIENNKIIMKVDITVKQDVLKANIFEVFYKNLKDIVCGNISIA